MLRVEENRLLRFQLLLVRHVGANPHLKRDPVGTLEVWLFWGM
jgi:hypothetical protein